MKETNEEVLIHRSHKKKSHLFRKTVSCFTSNITIVFVVIGYIVGGGFLFKYMEEDAEFERLKQGSENVNKFKQTFIIENKKQIQAFKNRITEQTKQYFKELKGTADFIGTTQPPSGLRVSDVRQKEEIKRKMDKLVSLIKNMSFGHVESYTSQALRTFNDTNSQVTDDFIEQIYNTMITGFVIDFNENNVTLWTLPGSILYSVTVITTIGYGNIVPKTTGGKLSTIFYAMFGIPLMLICLANLGSFFAEILTLFYNCIIKRCRCKQSKSRQRSRSCSPGYPINKITEPNRSASVPNKLITGKTLTVLSNKVTNETKISKSNLKSQEIQNYKRQRQLESIEFSDVSENYPPVQNDQKNLPLSFALFLFIIYILIGAIFIANWEEWDYLNSVYFVFITFSTIGFGDLVPGSKNYQWSSHLTPILCALYLLLGLVLVSVCFQLIQDSIRKRARKMGQHIGLLHSHSVY